MNSRVLLLILVFLASLSGCGTLTPKTYHLENIHHKYTDEWSEYSLQALTGPTVTSGINTGNGAFNNTLAGIRNYKKIYGEGSKVAAHLTVLEGMIYIQSGKTGMARLLVTEVRKAKEKLGNSAGIAVRDYIFADCYEELTSGWEAIYQVTIEGIDRKSDNFKNPADGIARKLTAISKDLRAQGDLDSGGAYVATSAAIFYLWAYSAAQGAGNLTLQEMAMKGKDVLEPWLSDDEISCVKQGIYTSKQFDWGSRQRYLDWYDYLLKKSGDSSSLN